MYTSKTTSFLITTLFLSLLIITTTPYLSAQEEEKKDITYEKLLESFEKNEVVEDRMIDGSHIIKIIEETDYDIKITNSVITT